MNYVKHLFLSLLLLSVGSVYAAGERNGERPPQRGGALRDRVPARYNLQVIPPQAGQQGGEPAPQLVSPAAPRTPGAHGREVPIIEETRDE